MMKLINQAYAAFFLLALFHVSVAQNEIMSQVQFNDSIGNPLAGATVDV
jgi:hypothetical protein